MSSDSTPPSTPVPPPARSEREEAGKTTFDDSDEFEDEHEEDVEEDEEEEEEEQQPQEDGATYKARGNDYYSKGLYREAIEAYTQAIKLEPDNAAYYGNRSAAELMRRRYRACLKDCERALELDSSLTKIRARQAKAYLQMGDASRALEMYKTLQREKIDPTLNSDVQSAADCVRTFTECKKTVEQAQWSRAISLSRGLLRVAPDAPPYQLMLCEGLIATGKAGEACKILGGLITEDDGTTNVDALCLRARALFYMGQENISQAQKNLQHALGFDPDHVLAKEWWKKIRLFVAKKEEGNTHFQAGKWSESLDAYTAALEVDPNNAAANSVLFCNRAASHMKLSNFSEALKDCTRAIDIDKGYVKAWIRRARCHQSLEQHDAAVRDLTQAYELSSTSEVGNELRQAKILLKRSLAKDYYKILGVPRDASDRDIKKAYREQALKLHPDKMAGATDEEKDKAEKAFKDIGEAYEILNDPAKRRKFDNGQLDNNGQDAYDSDEYDHPFMRRRGGGGGFRGGNPFGGGFGGPSFSFHFG